MQRSDRQSLHDYAISRYKNSIGPIFKDQYIKLYPTGDNSLPTTFYGLPRIHKANILFRPIVLAFGTFTYNMAKFLT